MKRGSPRLVALLGVGLVCGGCADYAAEREAYNVKQVPVIRRELGRLKGASPALDLQRAWHRKDYRFVGVGSFRSADSKVAGVEGSRSNSTVDRYGMAVIPGTDVEASYSPEAARLHKAALAYAIAYNQMLMAKLQINKMTAPPYSSRPTGRYTSGALPSAQSESAWGQK